MLVSQFSCSTRLLRRLDCAAMLMLAGVSPASSSASDCIKEGISGEDEVGTGCCEIWQGAVVAECRKLGVGGVGLRDCHSLSIISRWETLVEVSLVSHNSATFGKCWCASTSRRMTGFTASPASRGAAP